MELLSQFVSAYLGLPNEWRAHVKASSHICMDDEVMALVNKYFDFSQLPAFARLPEQHVDQILQRMKSQHSLCNQTISDHVSMPYFLSCQSLTPSPSLTGVQPAHGLVVFHHSLHNTSTENCE